MVHVLVQTDDATRLVPSHVAVGGSLCGSRIVAYHEDNQTLHLAGGPCVTKDDYDSMDSIIQVPRKLKDAPCEAEYVSHPVAGEGHVEHSQQGCTIMSTHLGTWSVCNSDIVPMASTPILMQNVAIAIEAMDNRVVYIPPVLCSTGAMGFFRQVLGLVARLGVAFSQLPTLCDVDMPVRALASVNPQKLVLRGGKLAPEGGNLLLPLAFDTFSPSVMCENTFQNTRVVTPFFAALHSRAVQHLVRWPEVVPIAAKKLISGVFPKATQKQVKDAIESFPPGVFNVLGDGKIYYVRPQNGCPVYPLPAGKPIKKDMWIKERKAGIIVPEMLTPFVCRACYNKKGPCCTGKHMQHRFVKHTTQGQYMFVTCA